MVRWERFMPSDQSQQEQPILRRIISLDQTFSVNQLNSNDVPRFQVTIIPFKLLQISLVEPTLFPIFYLPTVPTSIVPYLWCPRSCMHLLVTCSVWEIGPPFGQSIGSNHIIMHYINEKSIS